MTEEEQLGIAEEQTPEETTVEETVEENEETPEGEFSKEEIMAMCVRYEKARTPWAEDAEARQIAVANASGEDAEEYLKEVLAWHEAGEPEIAEAEEVEVEEKGPEGEVKEKSEEEMLGIAD